MKLKHCLITFFILAPIVLFEYYALNSSQNLSFLHLVKDNTTLLQSTDLSTKTGGPISLALGITGFIFLVLTNLYSLRKRFDFLNNLGSAESYLNAHILFGLLGSLLVILHTDFKLGGIAAVAFWSLIISVVTGVAGDFVNPNLDETNRKSTKTILGYWHSLHIPFSISMYVFGILHIVVATLFRIGINS